MPGSGTRKENVFANIGAPEILIGLLVIVLLFGAILGMWNPLTLNGRNLRMQVRGSEPGATVRFQEELASLGELVD